MTNLETESSTVTTVLSTINNQMANGTLSDPQNTENVEDIPVNTGKEHLKSYSLQKVSLTIEIQLAWKIRENKS